MATAAPKAAPRTSPSKTPLARPEDPWLLRACDVVYRFLASLKLAVISLSLSATTLAVATFIESAYGAGAAQEYIYRSKGFMLLLAFLGINILCAALIRYPWTKRQTGFVITHAGLLVVLLGSFLSVQYGYEGQVAIKEGESSDEMVRDDHPVLRVEKVDPHTGTPTVAYAYPFFGGSFAWRPGRVETLTGPQDPFRLEVTGHIPASTPRLPLHERDPDGDGVPMLKAALLVKPPGAPEPTDVLARGGGGDGWLVVDSRRVGRAAKDAGPASFAFQFVEGPHADELVDDFLHPPAKPLTEAVARIHYEDRSGRDRLYEWPVTRDASTEAVRLPDSDLTVSSVEKVAMPLPPELAHLGAVDEATGRSYIEAIKLQVRRDGGPAVEHFGWGSLPMVPSFIPGKSAPAGATPLVRVGYFHPPAISQETMRGRFGVIEVLATRAGKLYYRAFGRDGLKGIGPVALGQTVTVFGGGKAPMSVSFRLDELILEGRTRMVCEPIELPKDKKGQGTPACEALLTVDGHTERVWVRRTQGFDPEFVTVTSPAGTYRLAYDYDRRPLGFGLKLLDFEVGMDPGTQQPSSYTSEVLLTDEGQRIKDRPVTITMNEPMTHRGVTLYQSNYIPQDDPMTGAPTGRYVSVLSLHYDPAWQVIYGGCFLVIFGTFVQFYMRAGIFTDGGKAERARAAARARKAALKAGHAPPPTAAEPIVAEALPEDEPL